MFLRRWSTHLGRRGTERRPACCLLDFFRYDYTQSRRRQNMNPGSQAQSEESRLLDALEENVKNGPAIGKSRCCLHVSGG